MAIGEVLGQTYGLRERESFQPDSAIDYYSNLAGLLPQRDTTMPEFGFDLDPEKLATIRGTELDTANLMRDWADLKNYAYAMKANQGIDITRPDFSKPESIEANQLYLQRLAKIQSRANQLMTLKGEQDAFGTEYQKKRFDEDLDIQDRRMGTAVLEDGSVATLDLGKQAETLANKWNERVKSIPKFNTQTEKRRFDKESELEFNKAQDNLMDLLAQAKSSGDEGAVQRIKKSLSSMYEQRSGYEPKIDSSRSGKVQTVTQRKQSIRDVMEGNFDILSAQTSGHSNPILIAKRGGKDGNSLYVYRQDGTRVVINLSNKENAVRAINQLMGDIKYDEIQDLGKSNFTALPADESLNLPYINQKERIPLLEKAAKDFSTEHKLFVNDDNRGSGWGDTSLGELSTTLKDAFKGALVPPEGLFSYENKGKYIMPREGEKIEHVEVHERKEGDPTQPPYIVVTTTSGDRAIISNEEQVLQILAQKSPEEIKKFTGVDVKSQELVEDKEGKKSEDIVDDESAEMMTGGKTNPGGYKQYQIKQ